MKRHWKAFGAAFLVSASPAPEIYGMPYIVVDGNQLYELYARGQMAVFPVTTFGLF